MIARPHRVRTDRDIKRIFRTGRKYGVSELTFFVLPNRVERPRFAVVVGGTVSKKAVVRNRLKRQVRDVLRRAVVNGAIAAPQDMVVMVRPSFAALPDSKRVLFVEQLLLRLHLAKI